VSNSSSTSFCIYGVKIDGNLGYEEEQVLQNKFAGTDMEIIQGECDSYYIGRSWSNIEDNETGKQFKDFVKRILKKAGISTEDLGTHEDRG